MSDLDARPDTRARLRELLPSLPRAVELSHFGSELAVVCRDVEGAEADIVRLEAFVSLAPVVRETLEANDRATLQAILPRVIEAGTALSAVQQREQLKEGRTLIQGTRKDIERVGDILRRAWDGHVQSQFKRYEKLGAVLRRIPSTRDLGARIERVASKGLSLAKVFPPPQETLAQFAVLNRELDAHRGELTALGAGPDVEEFFAAVVDDRATLEHVTTGVREWLAKHSALNLLHVKLE